MGQKGVLLGFVKTVYLVNKQNRSPILCQVLFGKGYRSTNLFDPTEHRRQADPLAARFGGKQLGEGSFSSTRRPPKQHRMNLPAGSQTTQGFIVSK
jgi:hypothetical protein